MGADEQGTYERFRAHRLELIDPIIAEHGGRIVKLMGDGFLVEFGSVVRTSNVRSEFNAAWPHAILACRKIDG
jgi:class 3 adenylate cyclase